MDNKEKLFISLAGCVHALKTNLWQSEAKVPVLEREFHALSCDRNANRQPIDGPLLRNYSVKLLKMADERSTETEDVSFDFSNGWFVGLKRLLSLKFRHVHGESGSST